jgi:hypothetical protein
MEEDRIEQGRKKAERTSTNDYIYERNKAELLNLITEYGRIHTRNKAKTGVHYKSH